jgi:hypothetical protein
MAAFLAGTYLDQKCDQCGIRATAPRRFSRCSRCAVARYCGPACQKLAWPEHKHKCQVPNARVLAAAQAVLQRIDNPVQPAMKFVKGLRLVARAGAYGSEITTGSRASMSRTFVLKGGKSVEALSNAPLPFDLSEIPDEFGIYFAMHVRGFFGLLCLHPSTCLSFSSHNN